MNRFVVHYKIEGEDSSSGSKESHTPSMADLKKIVQEGRAAEYDEIYDFLEPMKISSFMTSMYVVEYQGTHKELAKALLDHISEDVRQRTSLFVTPFDEDWSFHPADLIDVV